jgi:hypothetical protein
MTGAYALSYYEQQACVDTHTLHVHALYMHVFYNTYALGGESVSLYVSLYVSLHVP